MLSALVLPTILHFLYDAASVILVTAVPQMFFFFPVGAFLCVLLLAVACVQNASTRMCTV